MSRRKFFQLITVATLLLITLTWSSALACPPTLGKGSRGVDIQSTPWGSVLSQVSSPGSVAASTPLNAAMSDAGDVRINEVMFYPDTGGYEWVELKNNGPASVNISGYSITDEDGNWYRIPDGLPDVPGGAFVVVIFDGLGSDNDDYDFSDNVATLHTPAGLVDVFEDDADQCALYSVSHFIYLPIVLKNYTGPTLPEPVPSTGVFVPPIVSFVAWGGPPGTEAGRASAAGIWETDWYVSLARGLGEESLDVWLAANESIGLLPGSQTSYADDWTLFLVGEVTQGGENLFPIISWYYPAAGATVDSATFAISWNAVAGATGYRFQMDDNADFSSPTEDTILSEPAYVPTSPVPEGTYYWRVKVIFEGGESSWSSGVEINSLTLPSPPGSSVEALQASYKVLGIAWQLQHKDTNMLCLDGDPETGNFAWDAPHTGRGIHGRNYCVRASVSMIASYYGGQLSQDRISYETFKGGPPEGDLGHDVPFTGAQARASLSWALGTNVPAQFGKPTFDQIKAWIDADRPMRAVIPGHSRVIDGYFEFSILGTTWQFLHILDPWDRAKWVNYADDDITYVQVCPAGAGGAPNVRSDEDMDGDGIADTIDDSDGDGICDFDERNRFRGNLRNLNANDPDSDDDLVPDKLDMREYLFDNAGNYSRRTPDIDGDGDRKETDSDNDNFWDVGSIDGCEDTNQNGRFEPGLGETNNFDPTDEKECPAPLVDITSPASGSSDDDCVITLEGTIHSETDLSSASVLVTSGPQSNRFDLAWSGSTPDYSFSQETPLFSGDNLIMVTAVNQFGSGSAHIYVECTMVVRDIHVQLYWPLLGADVDLHFIRPGGTYWSIPDDCHWRNMNPDWGVPGDPTDDPELDVDCITTCTLENIVLSRPVTGTYSVKVHYYSDHGRGPTNPTVRVWVQGERYDFGPHYMTNDQVWSVCTIEWPSKVVTPGGLVTSQSPDKARSSQK